MISAMLAGEGGWVQLGEYEMDTSDVLGKGMFACVYMGRHRETGEKVAVKEIDLHRLSSMNRDASSQEEAMHRVKSEIKLMRNMQHPNIVRCFDMKSVNEAGRMQHNIYLVLEYCDMDLDHYLRHVKQAGKRLTEADVRTLMNDFVAGLRYLRQKHVVHRDLKPQNILTQASKDPGRSLPVLKIADFGFARLLPHEDVAETQCGTPLYMAPEIFRQHKYGVKADLWSVGCIMYQMLFGRPPIEAKSRMEIQRKAATEGLVVRYPKNMGISESCHDLLRGLLQQDPDRRISWEELFGHRWLREAAAAASALESFEREMEVIPSGRPDAPAARPVSQAVPIGGRQQAGSYGSYGSPGGSSIPERMGMEKMGLAGSPTPRKPLVSPFKEHAPELLGGRSPIRSPRGGGGAETDHFVFLASHSAMQSVLESASGMDEAGWRDGGGDVAVRAMELRLRSCQEIVQVAERMRDEGRDGNALCLMVESLEHLKATWAQVTEALSGGRLTRGEEEELLLIKRQVGERYVEYMKPMDLLAMRTKPEGNPLQLIYDAAWKSAKEAAVEEYFRTSKKSETLYASTLALLSFLRIRAKSERDESTLDRQMELVRVRLNQVLNL